MDSGPDKEHILRELADHLRAAYSGPLCSPIREQIGLSIEDAYAIQQINTQYWIAKGRRVTGKKIGLTARSVQRQLGVDQPDFGALFADMELGDGEEIDFGLLQQPRAEAEIAMILDSDIDSEQPTIADLLRSIAFVVPAIEVVGSRIAGWDIKISDTVADNASSSFYALGGPARSINGIDLAGCQMIMTRNGIEASVGCGSDCLGHPLNAAVWLARQMVKVGTPLRAGNVIMSGALALLWQI
jgi:2-keto-4-pentenoate hydratase